MTGLVLVGAVFGGLWLALQHESARVEPQSIVEVVGATSSRDLSVTVAHASCGTEPEVAVEERAGAVRLRGELDEGTGCDDIGLQTTLHVELGEPLGDRAIEVRKPASARGRELVCTVDGAVSGRCERS